ncbi:DUF5994 family protein [Nocardia neocaledoniensis]|uniref:DUF5994 family protein n=1 Tax=Nocardia neocaledoniensis TaxID=236511 RepID=UPI00245591A8|nr:DUF5994 family protein [Nocardia neocaledoniensis]
MRIPDIHRLGGAPAPARHQVPPLYTPRLRMRSRSAPDHYIDGAWWPRSDDLAAELPDVLAVLGVRLGPIWRVVYDPTCWGVAPARITVAGETVRLDSYHFELWNTMYVFGRDASMLVLRVIPADTDARLAHESLMAAADSAGPPESAQRPPRVTGRRMCAPDADGQPFGTPTRTPRLLLRGTESHAELFDGAWWPRTANLTAELHDLISAVTPRLGRTARISFDWNATSRNQRRIDHPDGVDLQVPDIGQLPDTMRIIGDNGVQLTLLVIAADTPADIANAQILHAVGRVGHHLPVSG